VKNDAAEIGAAGIDRCRKQEVQHQMMQRDRGRAGEDRAIVAIGGQTSQGGEEVHMRIGLPGMSGQLVGEHRSAAHQRDSEGQAGRETVARAGP
jgi:hypothetical protein